ncbi:alanine racemase C-terminal domain-containing protein [Microbacterium sp. NPDC056736]|uniref:alanine racemase C-terminal domain-containing protein n=1 Tax=Microbacterium sp. NPDC056736 TaxID=3345932 RepID=UPI00366E4143
MSSSIPGHAATGSDPRSAPVARVSRAALAANARAARERGIRRYGTAVLQADAWGHGAALVQQVLDAARFASAGDGTPADADDVLAPETLFGLPGGDAGTTPALRLSGTVLSIKDLRAGEGVSYGYAFRAPADTRIALVTGGYAQGVVRELGGAVDVSIAGERHPVVGRVAMDVCVVDVADAAVRRGDEALFLGDPGAGEPSLADWVRVTGLRSSELITTVGLRALREELP